MHIMGLISIKLLLFLAFEHCFRCTDAQELPKTDANVTFMLPSNDTVQHAAEIISASPANNLTELQTEPDLYRLDTTLVSTTAITLENPTTVNTLQINTETEQTPSESISETTNTAQIEQTTMAITAVPTYEETSATDPKTTEAPTTSPHEITSIFHFLTTPTERPTDLIITTSLAMTTDSPQQLNPTLKMTDAPEDVTEYQSIMPTHLDRGTTFSTETLTSTSQSSVITTVSTDYYTTFTVSENVDRSILPIQTNWLLIIIVCVIIICCICVGMILLVQQRKKRASRTFSSMHVNGQSKRSKKKKGAEDDAWAGPVNLEAGAECNAEEQDGLLSNDGKQDADDVVLSTFAALDEGDMTNGGVGEKGSKEAKKWEEQEPMLYIDEDVDNGKARKSLANNEGQKGDDKNEEKEMNGETFCLTTAV